MLFGKNGGVLWLICKLVCMFWFICWVKLSWFVFGVNIWFLCVNGNRVFELNWNEIVVCIWMYFGLWGLNILLGFFFNFFLKFVYDLIIIYFVVIKMVVDRVLICKCFNLFCMYGRKKVYFWRKYLFLVILIVSGEINFFCMEVNFKRWLFKVR